MAVPWPRKLDCLPSTTGVSSSCLGHSIWGSWWVNLSLVSYSSRFLPFSPATNFIRSTSPTHLMHNEQRAVTNPTSYLLYVIPFYGTCYCEYSNFQHCHIFKYPYTWLFLFLSKYAVYIFSLKLSPKQGAAYTCVWPIHA